jgi:hypothetical protein
MSWRPGPLENSCIYGAQLVPLALLLGGPSKILNLGPPDITLHHWVQLMFGGTTSYSERAVKYILKDAL